jgi:hypothetical protein
MPSPEKEPKNNEMPAGERQMLIKNIFIKHDRFKDAWNFLKRAHYPVDGGRPDFGCISTLVGESRAGKTSVATRYMQDHPPSVFDGGMAYPVLYVNIPIDGQRALLGFIADALGLKYSLRINNPTLLLKIMKALVDQKVELLIFDEVNTVVAADNKRALVYSLDLLRKLLDSCQLNIVCIGLSETYGLLASDPQITGRGGLPYQIVRPYTWENEEERKLFRLLCHEFDLRLPFNQRSNLQDNWFSHRLYYSSRGGIVGRLRDFLYSAGCLAINDGTEAVESRHFAEAYEKIKPWGQTFNPWLHDLAQAPALNATPSRLAGHTVRESFSKKTLHAIQ